MFRLNLNYLLDITMMRLQICHTFVVDASSIKLNNEGIVNLSKPSLPFDLEARSKFAMKQIYAEFQDTK